MALIEFDENPRTPAKIKVIGVGGGGGNAINTMIAAGMEDVDFIAVNTDLQALDSNLAPNKVQIGAKLTKGLGAGAQPNIGREAALEDTARLHEVLQGADMIFVTAGMGGGTGTGAAPIIAQVAKEIGALTVGVVTKPFVFEGKKRMKQADEGMDALGKNVDTLISIPNQRLLNVAGQATTMLDAFRKVDEVLLNAVQGISELIITHGFINVDFADVRTIMSSTGRALMGIGYAMGDRKALEAARMAISSPLLEDATIDGATGILINITGGPDLTLIEVQEAATMIQEAAHDDANIIFGSVLDQNMEDQVRITVIATGFDRPRKIEEQHHHAHSYRPISQGKSTHQEKPQRQVTSVGGNINQAQAMSSALTMQASASVEPVYATASSAPVAQTPLHAYAPIQVMAPPSMMPTTMNNYPLHGNPAPIMPAPMMQAPLNQSAMLMSPQPIVPALSTASDTSLTGEYTQPQADATLTGMSQQAFDYQSETNSNNEAKENKNGASSSARRRSPTSPRVHPGLALAEEHEMDIPAFLRKNQQMSGE